jgi:hypothetical protein
MAKLRPDPGTGRCERNRLPWTSLICCAVVKWLNHLLRRCQMNHLLRRCQMNHFLRRYQMNHARRCIEKYIGKYVCICIDFILLVDNGGLELSMALQRNNCVHQCISYFHTLNVLFSQTFLLSLFCERIQESPRSWGLSHCRIIYIQFMHENI